MSERLWSLSCSPFNSYDAGNAQKMPTALTSSRSLSHFGIFKRVPEKKVEMVESPSASGWAAGLAVVGS
jgi:hypothetical protein